MSALTFSPLEVLVGAYGPAWRSGVLIDNTDRFVAEGGSIRVGRHATWAVMLNGKAFPVVCGALVEVATEDGPLSGRCGRDVEGDRGACGSHADERDEWMSMGERERCAWERAHDEMHP